MIARNGACFSGRHEDEVGAHAQGFNTPSLGVCLVGISRFTPVQWLQLKATVEGLAKRHDIPLVSPNFTVQGQRAWVAHGGVCWHRELPDVAKACPGFSVVDWLAGGLAPLAVHVA